MAKYSMNYESGTAGQVPATGLAVPGVSNVFGSVVYSAEQKRGTMSLKHSPAASSATYVSYGNASNIALKSQALAVQVWFYFTEQPIGAFIAFFDDADAANPQMAARVGINHANYPGKLYIQDSNTASAVAIGTVNNPTPLGRWMRLELYATAATSGATITAALYDGNATTPVDRVTSSAASTTAGRLSAVWIGKTNYNTYATPYWMDDVVINTAATSLITEAKPSPYYIWDGAAHKSVSAHAWSGSHYQPVIKE